MGLTPHPDIIQAGIAGLALDPRLVGVAVRKVHTMQSVAEQLHVPKIMQFFQLADEQSGVEITAVCWQEGGTGDIYVSVCLLFGTFIGNNGGTIGSGTDNAGLILLPA